MWERVFLFFLPKASVTQALKLISNHLAITGCEAKKVYYLTGHEWLEAIGVKLIAKVPVKQTWRLASDLTGSHQCEGGVKEVYSLVVSRLPVVCKEDADLAAKTNYMPSSTETKTISL